MTVDFSRLELLDASPATTTELNNRYVKGLAPGAYAVYGTPETSAIESIGAEASAAGFSVEVVGGNITVTAADGRTLAGDEFEVYTTTGMRVSPLAPAKGIYIVRALGATAKIRI